MKHHITLYIILALTILSCKQEKVSFDEEKLQAAIADIDEFKAAIADEYVGMDEIEKRDVNLMIDEAKGLLDNGEYEEARNALGNGAISKSTIDSANIAWSTLSALCKEKKYRKAYDYINDKHTQGQLMMSMPHSTPRFRMIAEVICPLMLEYEERETALAEYLFLVKFEYYLEQTTILINADQGYIPKAYPNVIVEMGGVLAASGKKDEALELAEEYDRALYTITGDMMYVRCMGLRYITHILQISGEEEDIPQIVEILKEEIMEMVPDNSEGKQDFYMSIADSILNR